MSKSVSHAILTLKHAISAVRSTALEMILESWVDKVVIQVLTCIIYHVYVNIKIVLKWFTVSANAFSSGGHFMLL